MSIIISVRIRIYNKYAGYQDPYGCGIGGFKRINLKEVVYLNLHFYLMIYLMQFDMHLMFTGVTRNAEDECKDVTEILDKVKPLLDTVMKHMIFFMKKIMISFYF